ncbi:multidrug resistance protein 3 [Blastocladiella britannica]|nr:multidrug resistance protein 3 [Blastocladiella britannica]
MTTEAATEAVPLGSVTPAAAAVDATTADAPAKGDAAKDPLLEEKEVPGPEPVPFMQLFRYADGKDKVLMAFGLLSAIIFGTGLPMMTIVFGQITDSFTTYAKAVILTPPGGIVDPAAKQDLEDKIVLSVIYFIVIGSVAFLCAYAAQALFMVAGENQAKRIRQKYIKSVLRAEIAYYDAVSPGDVTTRLTSDISLVQDGISEKVSLTVQYAATFISGFVVAFTKGWQLTLVLLAVTPLMALTGALMANIVGASSNKSQASYASAGAIAQETLMYIRTVVSFGGEERAAQEYERRLENAYRVNVRKAVFTGLFLGLFMLIMFGTYALAFWYGSKLVYDGQSTGGTVLNVFFAVIIGAQQLGIAGPNVQVIATARGAAAKVFEVIERVPTIDTQSDAGTRIKSVRGDIELRNVKFHYPTRPDVPILKDFSLTIKAGESVALVGESGSGKSTIIQLVERFYDPVEGQILVDGVDIKDYHLQTFREHLGLVSQEPVLFDATIAENVALGAISEQEVTREQIVHACELSNAAKFIGKLPEGYDTPVGERGALLSGGQKQRVAIARSILKDPKILLLDEATSALDTESERVVQDALDRAAEGRTTLTIAHRLSTIRNYDKIVVMRKGEIVEVGNHAELIARGGYYSELVRAQEVRTDKAAEAGPVADVDEVVISHNHLDASGNRSTVLAMDGVTPDLARVKSAEKLGAAAATSDSDSEDEVAVAEKAKKVNVSLTRLFKMQLPELPMIAFGILGAAGNGAHMPLFAVIFSRIQSVFGSPDREKVYHDAQFWVYMFLALAGACFFINLVQHSMFGISGERLTRRVRAMAFRSLLRQNIGFFDEKKHGTGALTHHLSDESDRIQGATGVWAGQIVQLSVTLVTGMTIAFISSWKLTLIIIACVPIMAVGGALQMKVLSGGGKKTAAAYSAAAQVTVDALTSIRTVASLTKQEYFYKRFCADIEIPYKISLRKAWIGSLGTGFSQGVMFWVFGAAFYAGFRLVFDDGLDVGDMFQALYSVVFGAMALGQMSTFGPNIGKARIAAASFFELIDRVPPIDSLSTEGETHNDIDGSVDVKDVHFAYPTRADAPILRGFNAAIPAGKKIALAGASGGGKSTIIGLLERWYDVGSGSVSVDGTDVKKWNLSNMRSHIALVGQEPQLFDLSIVDNIKYGKPDATMAEVEEAAKLANIHNFITSLPEGYETRITGAMVSGGQKQRIAIARATLRKPRILLLDEATSALDSESEHVVQEALDRASEGRTTVTIAHRLSTIQDADLILCLRDGVVVEQGTHDELYRKNGLYASLVNQQRLGQPSV